MSDLDEIQQLKYRYFRHLDLKQWDAFATTLDPNVTADYAGLKFEDRATLVDFMRENLGPRMITLHQAHHPDITVDGDEAVGHWYLADKVLMPDLGIALEGAAFYEDLYRRTPEGWVIAHTCYQRTYEMSTPLDPSSLKIGNAY